ncbi:glycoside hydrolase family 95 protein [Sphingobacteriaceae bacterium WQ 2009]|uniref:Glycoside hydrolase family 95 protein n=1 Tax=Rhinopithecimicrobium faecis TaxID=2820698 RepID=A0A8T4H5V5_9SPHI|nr:glycoside hydrolase family 95 protein [Sphingobacteriaceae bacterium WQ 2009]
MKKILSSLVTLVVTLSLQPSTPLKAKESLPKRHSLQLWYAQPAARWEETLPIGNGSIGMMPDGQVQQESIVLNEISMWSGSPEDPNNYSAYKQVSTIQQLLFSGKNKEAEKLVDQNFICQGLGSNFGNGATAPYGSYQNFGFLKLKHQIPGKVENYERSLDIQDAVAYTSFEANGTTYQRTYFTSQDENFGLVSLTADRKKSISFKLDFSRKEAVTSAEIRGNTLTIQGQLTDGKGGKGLTFAAQITLNIKGGTLRKEGSSLMVEDADQATILFAATTSYYGLPLVETLEGRLKNAQNSATEKLLKEHKKAYHSVFNRVRLQLNPGNSLEGAGSKISIPTDQRLAAFYKAPQLDNEMASLYYQFGRYLTISSTAPKMANALPPNLQGLWAHEINTPWNGDYHLNVNAQMNHWGVEVSNLSEYHLPFIAMIKRLAKEGEKTAKAYYNAPGWVVYMMTNVWGYTAPGESASWGASTASGWLCNHLWEHYLFTKDKAYLKEIYPILKNAATFYAHTMVKDPVTGWWVTSPSVSPENAFRLPSGQVASIVMGPTIDNQIVRELYGAVLAANKILALNDSYAEVLAQQLTEIPPAVQVSKSGRVMEWLQDYEEVEPKHRHVSHLYGLYPAAFISPQTSPEWAEAARKTLTVRGDEGTGWSRAWKLLFWARLQDGNHSLEILRQLLQPAYTAENPTKVGAGTYPNLFCAHPPFQIDGNFGGSAGIAEMLIQSHAGFIHLLPALPESWSSGSYSGLKARGGYTVDVSWENGLVTSYKITGNKGEAVDVLVNGKKSSYKL